MIGGEMRRQDFQCHPSPQASIFGQINFTHPAFTKFRADFVRAEFCARG